MSSEQIQLFITSLLRHILKMRKKEQRKIGKNAELFFSHRRNSGSIFVGRGDKSLYATTFFPWNGTCHIYTFTSAAPSNDDCYFRNVTQDKSMTEKYSKLRLLHLISGFIKY